MTPVLQVQLWGGPEDGDSAEVAGVRSLVQCYLLPTGSYRRDPTLDLVRSDGTPVHRYRWVPATAEESDLLGPLWDPDG